MASKPLLQPAKLKRTESKREKKAARKVLTKVDTSIRELIEYALPSNAPSSLNPTVFLTPPAPSSGWFKTEVKTDPFTLKLARSVAGSKIYRIPVGTNLAINANGSGFINAVIATATVAATSDFTTFAGIFDQFFVVSMTAHYTPVSRYNYPLTGVTATSVSSLPLQVTSLQHASAAYSTTSTMANHDGVVMHNTADPFVHKWINVEKPCVMVAPTSSGLATQNWCETAATPAALYTGQIQFLTDQSTPPLQVSARIGSFLVRYDVLWRVRE
jgi:hypothetical protein